MKKLNKRIVSALLVAVLFLSNFPLVTFAGEGFSIAYEGKTVKQVEFKEHEKITVTAEGLPGGSYQWQIKIPGTDQWVNIHGQTGQAINLSKAVVGSLMSGDSAQVRCAAVDGGAELSHTAALRVTVNEDEPAAEMPKVESVVKAPSAKKPAAAPQKKPAKPVAAPTEPAVTPTEIPEVPAETTAESVETPVVPTEAPVAPTEAAVAPTEAPVAPTEAPAAPTEAAVAPTEAPVVPTEAPVAPTEAPVVPTEAPVAPTEAPAAPTEAPVAPTEAPVVPTEVPVVPTEPAVVPTEQTTPVPTECAVSTEPSVEPFEAEKETVFDKIVDMVTPRPAANESADVEIVTVKIHYRAVDRYGKFETTREDASLVENAARAEPVTDSEEAHIVSGSSLNLTIPCHVIPGYTLAIPSYYDDDSGIYIDGNNLQLSLASVTEDITFYVYYVERKVPYSARYYMQNVYNDLYTEKTDILSDSEKAKMTGYPGDAPDVTVIYPTYPGENGRPGNAKVMGFTPLFFQPDTIAADGSTVFEVYYDRNYYLMNFNMDGGFGTAPVYARYGTAFTVAQPTKPGYVFAGWELEKVNGANASAEQKEKSFPTTIPAENRTYKAVWTTVDASYTVAYWILNDKNTASEADDVKTYLGSQRRNAQSGSSVSGFDDLRQSDGKSVLICGEEASDKHTHSDATCRVNATDLRYMDFVKADQNVIVEGDGSTVVNAYYEYREYTLKFYYAMSSGSGTGTSYYVVGGSTYGFGAEASSYVDRNSEVALLSQYLGNGGWHTRTGSAAEMPVLNTKGQARGYTMGSDDATVGNTKYQYHYISFKARYGDDISNLWPCDVFSSVTMNSGSTSWTGSNEAFVSAWNGEYNVYYSRNNSNQTIKGNYQKLDYKLLWQNGDPSDMTVTYLCFWENGASVGWSIPELYIYNIWLSCTNNKPENAPIDPVTGQRKETKELTVYGSQKQWFYLDNSYHTVDDSTIGAQTRPALTGYHLPAGYAETDWYVIFLNNTEYNSGGFYQGQGGTKYRPNQAVDNVESADSPWPWYQTQTLNRQTLPNGKYLFYSDAYNPTNPVNGVDHALYMEAFERDFYYYANKHTLFFWNHDDYLTDGSGVPLEFNASLKVYGDTVTAQYMDNYYPDELEPNAYYFDGWYTSPNCMPGTEMNWNSTMPDSDLTVYAKWEPVKYNVSFYMDYERYISGDRILEISGNSHGQQILSEKLNPIQDLKFKDKNGVANEAYRFVNWFYIDGDGTKKAFNPAEMAIRKELHLFAEWTTTTVKEYTVSYHRGEWDDATGTYKSLGQMAADTEGYALEATTKTFNAKPKDQLTSFPAGTENMMWLPNTNSHSIVMRPNNAENVFTFYYVMKDKAPYTVRYLDAATGEPLLYENGEEVMGGNAENKSAVVTVPFRYIEGYIPDAFHKQLILSADDSQNVIIFYYTKDQYDIGGDGSGGDTEEPKEERSLYLIVHHYPELNGTERQVEEEGIGFVGDEATAIEDPIPGFEFDEAATKAAYKDQFSQLLANRNVKQEDGKWTVTGTITTGADEGANKALKLHLYYKRIAYGYSVIHKDYETDEVIKTETFGIGAGKESERVPFQSTVRVKAEGITGYDIYAADADGTKTKAMTISWDESLNVITFYYIKKKITVDYLPVCTNAGLSGFGGVSIPREYDKTPTGSQAYASSGYRFLGWYENWGTDQERLVQTDARYTPTINIGSGIYEYSYYAVFEPITLTISQNNMAATDSAVYEILQGGAVVARVMLSGTDSVTLYAVPEGDYTVREASGNWTWTYLDAAVTPANGQIKVVAGQDKEVSFDYSGRYEGSCWLHSENHN